MHLFFDTETTGIPKNWKAPISQLSNWPRMVQIAWILSDNQESQIEVQEFIIKPEGFTIPRDAASVHGITTEKALAEGANIIDVLEAFNRSVKQSESIIAHNIQFDEKIILSEFLRANIKSNFNKKQKLCTMKASTHYCKIPGYYGYKWPKLSELHKKLFGHDFEEAHNALADISATARCFWEMRKKGLI